MSTQDSRGRVYGRMYRHTSTITELPQLAAYMLKVLNQIVGREHVPEEATFCFLVCGKTIGLSVHGIKDHKLLARPDVFTREATEFDAALAQLLDEFNWSNPNDALDRRFFPRVDLLTERQQQTSVYPPGRVWVIPEPKTPPT